MNGNLLMTPTIYILIMVAVVVTVDVLFFRNANALWQRLAANVGLVLVFLAFYFRFVKRP